jgi:hypothetical protein
MRLIAAVVAVLLLGQMTAEDRAERLAKMAQRIDVQAAAGEVGEWQDVLRYALGNRDADLAKKAREGVKNAKRDLTRAKAKSQRDYMERAKRVTEDQGRLEGERQDRTPDHGLSPGEYFLERIRHAGPLLIGGVALQENEIGHPEVTVCVGNLTDRTIEAFDVEVECWNAFDEPMAVLGRNEFGATSQEPIRESEVTTATWMIPLRENTAKVAVRVVRVKPAYGNVWEQTREEAERAPGAIVTAKMRR